MVHESTVDSMSDIMGKTRPNFVFSFHSTTETQILPNQTDLSATTVLLWLYPNSSLSYYATLP